MKKLIIKINIRILLALVLQSNIALGQNIILDCDFQTGVSTCERTPSNYQIYSSILSATSYWNTCAKPLNFLGGNNFWGNTYLQASPDLIKDDCGDANRLLSKGTAGVKRLPESITSNNIYIGLAGNYNLPFQEGVIFDLETNFQGGLLKYQTLTFDLAFSDTTGWGDAGGTNFNPKDYKKVLKIYLSKWGENWNASSNNNILYEIESDKLVLPINSNPGWQTITIKFKIPEEIYSPDLNHLIIQAIGDESHPVGYYDYLYIDNVKLNEIDACQSMCLGDNVHSDIDIKNLVGASLTMIDVQDTNILANFDGSTRSDFKLFFTNTMYYNVKIFDRWGGQQYEYEAKDLNILEDDFMNIGGFMPDTTVFRWWGTSQDGTPLSNAGNTQMYTILINARNCTTNDFYGTSLAFQHLTETHNYTDIRPENFVDTLENCCPETLEVDNFTYTSSIRESRNNYIHAALNDLVVVESGVFVQYNAGNEVKLGTGFTVNSGAKFEVNIRDCEMNYYNHWKREPTSNGTFINDTKEMLRTISSTQENDVFMVYPNPVNSELFVYSFKVGSEYFILDIFGKVIDHGILSYGSNIINTKEYRKGTYIIRIENEHYEKIIKY